MTQTRGRNPFRPGDPVPDPYVGRVALRQAFHDDVIMRLEDSGAAPPFVLLGLSGVGKSASLNVFRDAAEGMGWVAPLRQKAERDMGLRTLMGRVIADVETSLGRMDISDSARTMLGQLAEVRLDLGFVSGTATTSKRAKPDDASLGQTLYELLERLADAAGDTNVVVFLDELHLLRPGSLRALTFAIEQTLNSRLPLAFVMTGLPHLRRLLLGASMYTLRFSYREIDSFSEDETLLALRETARTVAGQDVTDDAARLAHRRLPAVRADLRVHRLERGPGHADLGGRRAADPVDRLVRPVRLVLPSALAGPPGPAAGAAPRPRAPRTWGPRPGRSRGVAGLEARGDRALDGAAGRPGRRGAAARARAVRDRVAALRRLPSARGDRGGLSRPMPADLPDLSRC
jgi:hypothetical protein